MQLAELLIALDSFRWPTVHCKECGVLLYTVTWNVNQTFIWVISTPTVPYNTPLVWYVLEL